MNQPLEGLTVLDLSWVVAGPVVTRALADFGATVIRVESSTRIETARHMPPFHNGDYNTEGSALYGTWNAGKLGITVNLKTDKGQEIIRDLASHSDIVVEAFSPGTMEKWGLDYPRLSEGHPELIMLSTSINGQTGPAARLAGYGNVGAALSGFQEVTGWPDSIPLGPYGPYTDFLGPRTALPMVLAALHERDRTGQGSYIDASQVEAGVFFQSPETLEYRETGQNMQRRGNRDRYAAPHGVYPAADEIIGGRTTQRFVAVAVTTDAQWRALVDWLQRPEWLTDAALQTVTGRLARQDEIDTALGDRTRTMAAVDVEEQLQARHIPAHVAASSHDFVNDPQLTDRHHLVKLTHPLFGETTVEGARYQLSETPAVIRRAAPTLGQDNHQVLQEYLGYDDALITDLETEGVLK
jgi:crotonobetainyl-CoA:carnitine CoA-transferase CaiB-like acyl-CoA transferase